MVHLLQSSPVHSYVKMSNTLRHQQSSEDIVSVKSASVNTCSKVNIMALAQRFWTTAVVFLVPLILLPLPLIYGTPQAKCAYVVIIMAVYWMTEALPLPVTSLLPVFLFPAFGILTSKQTCANYMSDASFLLIGGLVIALAVEESNLHKRVALAVLIRVGSRPQFLMLGFVLVTGFLSMWISNTATVAMMLPTALEVTHELIRHKHGKRCSFRKRSRSWTNSDAHTSNPPQPQVHHHHEVQPPLSASETLNTLVFEIEPLTDADIPQCSMDCASCAKQSTHVSRRLVSRLSRMHYVQSEDRSIWLEPPEDKYKVRRVLAPRFSLNGGETSPWLLATTYDRIEIGIQTDQELEGAADAVGNVEASAALNDPSFSSHRLNRAERRLYSGMLLSICYAANIGGSATLTGTGPNLVLRGQLEKVFKGAATGLNYLSWMEFAMPAVIITLVLCWFWLQLAFVNDWKAAEWRTWFLGTPQSTNSKRTISDLLNENYRKLGPVSFAEISVLLLFVILILLWITREPGFMPGWGRLFEDSYVTDSSAVMFITTVLFMFPKTYMSVATWCSTISDEASSALLSWSSMQAKFPWGIVLLIGGGFAMAHGILASGLSDMVGLALKNALGGLSPLLICLVVILVVAVLTEVASNTSTTNIVLPLMISLAQSACIHPMYLAIPVAVASCFSFMLPASNPSNAIVFSTGRVKIADMLFGGFMVNIISIVVLLININTWGTWRFNLGTFPEWARTVTLRANVSSNGTIC